MVVMVMADGITFFELASVFKEDFGCKNAMYLDGVVSQMYIRNGAFMNCLVEHSELLSM